MTAPYEFSQVTDEPREKRPITDFIPWMRCTETAQRPGRLLVVRPLKSIEDYRPLPEGADPNKWRGKLTVVDVACLDPIDRAFTELGEELPGFPPGTIFRNNVVKLGYLNKAFRDHIGGMVIGTVYPVKTQYAKPAVHWRDLFHDEAAKARAQSFFQHFPQFFTPVPDPYEERQKAAQAAPTATAAPVATNWAQPDPWAAQNGSGAVAPAQATAAAADARQGMSTLDQMRAAATVQGEPPF